MQNNKKISQGSRKINVSQSNKNKYLKCNEPSFGYCANQSKPNKTESGVLVRIPK